MLSPAAHAVENSTTTLAIGLASVTFSLIGIGRRGTRQLKKRKTKSDQTHTGIAADLAMKRLLVLLPLLALASCSYPSKQEAEIACYEWASKGGEYIYIDRDTSYDWGKSLDLVQGK